MCKLFFRSDLLYFNYKISCDSTVFFLKISFSSDARREMEFNTKAVSYIQSGIQNCEYEFKIGLRSLEKLSIPKCARKTLKHEILDLLYF